MSTWSPDTAAAGRRRRARRSMALLIVLGVLALVSVLVLSFFGRATLNRTISFASAGQARADDVAETALQTVLGDLREEMRAGSSEVPGSAGQPAYAPTTNANMRPQRLLAGSNGFVSLWKESVGGSNLWSGPTYSFMGPIRSFPGNSTTNAARDGRYIPASRWQEPRFETNAVTPPDWIVVTRGGPATNAAALDLAALTNTASSNPNYAVGRYAYAVYDIGGLLDANVAGYASAASPTATDLSRKGSLALINLAGIGGLTQAQVDALVKWRNPGVTDYGSFTNYAFRVAGTNGYLYPAPGNQAFLTRQDLIRYAASNGIATALPFLTTFSREKNSPSWSPSGPLIPSAYAAAAETSTATNRDLANVRASDGTALIKSRFDLDRLAWVTWEGPSAGLAVGDPLYNPNGTAANIKKFFGLAWDSSAFSQTTELGQQWVYTSPDGTGTIPAMIKRLDQVAAAGREPDFFELLKAGILSGSLGLYSQGELDASSSLPSGPYSAASGLGSDNNSLNVRLNPASSGASDRLWNQVPDYQIVAIGANILNQYSTALYPVCIQTPGGNAIGTTSLPYLAAWATESYRPTINCATFASLYAAIGGDQYRSLVGFWLDMIVWNPYRNAATAATAQAPSAFRVGIVNGVAAASLWGEPDPYTRDFGIQPAFLNFANNTAYVDPTLLTAATGLTAYTDTTFPRYGGFNDSNGKRIAGIFMGYQNFADTNVIEAKNYPNGGADADPIVRGVATAMVGASPLDFRAQYQLPASMGSGWRSYQLLSETFLNRGSGSVYPYTNSTPIPMWSYGLGDPRDHRMGPGASLNAGFSGATAVTYRKDAASWIQGAVYDNRGGNIHIDTAPESVASYADNVSASTRNGAMNCYYADPDGVVRPGDAGDRGGLPTAWNATAGAARPLMLNQPFRSVADLGYAYRDQPWKSLDFASTNSADAGLLDLFGFYGGTASSLPVVAGKVDLNVAPAPVLQALLGNALVDYGADMKTMSATNSSSEVAAFVSALRPASGTPPSFLNKGDLVAFFATNVPSAYTVKAQREAPVRALANVVQTRTWNFLIDVVAQSGRYLPGATGPDQFTVEGEKHYWLQVAIDRFTGEIVDQELEPIYEQ